MYSVHNNLQDEPFAVLREIDGAWIPMDPRNSDFQRYLRWLEDPNAEDVAPPAPTL